MREFRVTLTHRAGELARLSQQLANHDVNLKSVAGISEGQKAFLCFVAEDVEAMRTALDSARVQFQEQEMLSELVEDGPGQIAELSGKLADAGVNLHSLYILARDAPLVEIGFTVDDPKKAKKALGI
jgi:hypothetical protein